MLLADQALGLSRGRLPLCWAREKNLPMPLGILYIFAKEPEPGRVKTRLCPPLRPAQAADLVEAFLGDMLETLVAAGAGGLFEVRLAASPGAGGPRLADLARRSGVACLEQGHGDLGRRMQRVMEAGLEEAEAVALVGGDLPDLPPRYVTSSFQMLAPGRGEAEPEVVLGPCDDGGYYLVAARRRVPCLFSIDVPWGGSGVFGATTTRLSEEGIVYSLVPLWSDVDDAASLASLNRRLESDTSACCPRTVELLARLRREGWQP